MSGIESVVAVYGSREEAEAAIREVQFAGFDLRQLSIVGRDDPPDGHVVGYYSTGERMKAWGASGAFWGGLWGLLFGSAFFWVPGPGPLLVAGPVVGWIVAALESAVVVGGLSVLGAGLYGAGIPKDSILRYESALKEGKFVLIAHGEKSEAMHAQEILLPTTPERLDHHAVTVQA